MSVRKTEQKSAYLFLLPAFLLLISVAVFPLVTVFYTSFRDEGFATSAESNFIGFENYRRLLSITIKELPALMVIDSETGELRQQIHPETGELVFEDSLNILPRRPYLYKEFIEFNLFKKKYVIGVTDRRFFSALTNTLQFALLSVFFDTSLSKITT